jgi:hypothetical protein
MIPDLGLERVKGEMIRASALELGSKIQLEVSPRTDTPRCVWVVVSAFTNSATPTRERKMCRGRDSNPHVVGECHDDDELQLGSLSGNVFTPGAPG